MSYSVLMSVDQVEALTYRESQLWGDSQFHFWAGRGKGRQNSLTWKTVSLKSYRAIVDESNYSLPWDEMWTLNGSNNLGQSSKSKDPKRMLITGRVQNLLEQMPFLKR